MNKSPVSVIRYEKPLESVRRAIDLCGGLNNLPSGAKVFIKPNVVFWTKSVPFPKWGVVTTSRVVHDVVALLKERGVDRIVLGEGIVTFSPKDVETPAHAFDKLGYTELTKRFGVEVVNAFERPYEKVDLGDGVELKFNKDYLESDFLVNLPVLKTHAQTVVSLGIKNIKGLIDVASRKKCHSADPEKDLHWMVAKLAKSLPESLTVLDGIYTNERGPGFDGKIRRSDLLVASRDTLAADKVGAKILGFDPTLVPHLMHAARNAGRPSDLSDVEVLGEPIERVAMNLEYAFTYNEDNTLPLPMEKKGIKGVSYPKYDLSICTYCSFLTGVVLTSIGFAWKGEPWDNVEVLTGKIMKPTPGKKTILLGKCLWEAHKNHPDIKNMIAIKQCPPSPDKVVKALHQFGIDVNPAIFENLDALPGFFMSRYEGKPEFDESLFRIE
jgi:uncharacterized protein (DUF362 family)